MMPHGGEHTSLPRPVSWFLPAVTVSVMLVLAVVYGFLLCANRQGSQTPHAWSPRVVDTRLHAIEQRLKALEQRQPPEEVAHE
jgi:hypothetical protein